MRSVAAVLVLTASTLACGGGPTAMDPPPTPSPAPVPTPTPLVSAACSAALLACGGGKTYCVSLRYTAASACRETDCLQSLATMLRTNGASTIASTGPNWDLGSNFQPGCVGTRADIAGTAQEAECLVQLLNALSPGANYTVDPTRCNVDGFPHMVVAR